MRKFYLIKSLITYLHKHLFVRNGIHKLQYYCELVPFIYTCTHLQISLHCTCQLLCLEVENPDLTAITQTKLTI